MAEKTKVTMKEPGEIRAAISKFQGDTTYTALKTRWDEDIRLYYLNEYDAGKGYQKYTTNLPRVFCDKLISMIMGSKLIARVPSDALNEENRRVAGNVERLAYGVLNLNDERMCASAQPIIRAQRAFYSVVRGGFVSFDFVHKDLRGRTYPLINTWDLYNTAYELGDDGTIWATRAVTKSKGQVKSAYGYDSEINLIEVVEFCDTENYGVFIGDEWVVPLDPHGLEYCPVWIHKAGSMPVLQQGTDTTLPSKTGESALMPIRGQITAMNRTVSDYLTMIRRGVKVPLGVWSPKGDVTINEDIWQVEKAGVIPFEDGVVIKPLIEPAMPQDAATMLNFVGSEMQRGSLPYTAYGELGFRLSGFAINQLQASMDTVLEPFLSTVERSYQVDLREINRQYAVSNLPPMAIRGRTSRNASFGMPEAELIKPADVVGEWNLEIRLTPVLPKDDAQRYQLASMAKRDMMLSDQTIMDELLGVEDTDLEKEKMVREWAANLPTNKLWEAYMAALADDPNVQTNQRAQNILSELKMRMAAAQPPGQQAGQPGAIEWASMENVGTGVPSGPTGVGPETMPPETMGGFPGGAMGAAGV